MIHFSNLFLCLDATNKTSEKLAALINYFNQVPARDAAWAVTYLIGKRPKSPINSKLIRQCVKEVAQLPEWLFEESYETVGDLAETVSLLLPDPATQVQGHLSQWIEEKLLAIADADETTKQTCLKRWWSELDQPGRFVFTKLLTGGWRIGVSQRLVTRALAESLKIEPDVIAHRLMGHWRPDDGFFDYLQQDDTSDTEASRPYPFFLAYPLETPVEDLGNLENWIVEWKWDGVRAQVIKRQNQIFIWSRGEELVSERFPEIYQAAEHLPDGTVLDGEILAWSNTPADHTAVRPFGELQRRLGRKKVGKKLLADVPVILLAYDLLEWQGEDIRTHPLHLRRRKLETVLQTGQAERAIQLSPIVSASCWAEMTTLHDTSRERRVEGFIIKEQNSRYGVGRKRGSWWKWKVEPYAVDGVLLYAQRGRGRRANLYTDYTFGVWQEGTLVPFAKAYSGLTDSEIREVDRFIRQNTVERFGPVRSVAPELVMELSFEGIRRSTRHKSGVAVRFPRISRWRRDKKAREADSIETVKALLEPDEQGCQ